jgi:hypothetical protein
MTTSDRERIRVLFSGEENRLEDSVREPTADELERVLKLKN